jgi:hypothetical protein
MINENVPILGSPSASFEQVTAYVLAQPRGEYTEFDLCNVILPTYYELCCDVEIDPVLAIAQMLHETGNLTSFWSQRPQRNPAGIGVNGRWQTKAPADATNWAFNPQRQRWEYGLSFATWREDAIPAHIGRLLAYVLPDGAENSVQRGLIKKALGYRPLPVSMRGSAFTLRALGKIHNPSGQGWASPGADYGVRIATIAQRMQVSQQPLVATPLLSLPLAGRLG